MEDCLGSTKAHAYLNVKLTWIPAVKPELAAEAFKNTLGCETLFAWARFVFSQPLVNLIDIRIKFGPLYLRRPPIPRRLRISQHLCNTVSAAPKIPSNLTTAQPILEMDTAHLQLQFHSKYPQALPSNERAKWTTFTPPATTRCRRYCGRVLHRRSHARRSELVALRTTSVEYTKDGT